MSKKLTKKKAAKMLKDGSARGKPLTKKQERYFASVAYGDTGYLDRDPEYADFGTVLFNAIPAVIGTVDHFIKQGREKRRLKQELAQVESMRNLSGDYATASQSQGARKLLEGYANHEHFMLSPNQSYLPFGKDSTSYAWTGINVPLAYYNLGSSIWEQYGKNPNISKETVGFGASLIPYIASMIGGRQLDKLGRKIRNTQGELAHNLLAIQDHMGGTSLYTKYGGLIPVGDTELIPIAGGNAYEIRGGRHKIIEGKDKKRVIIGGAPFLNKKRKNTVYAETGEILYPDEHITAIIPKDKFIDPALKEEYPVLEQLNKKLKEGLNMALKNFSESSKIGKRKSEYPDKIGDASNGVNMLASLWKFHKGSQIMTSIQEAINALKPLNDSNLIPAEKEKDFAQTGFVANTDPSDEVMKKAVEKLRQDMKRKNEEGLRSVLSDLESLRRLEETSAPISPEQKKIYEGEYDLMYGSSHRRKEKILTETLDEKIGRLLKDRAYEAFWDEYNIPRKSKGDEIIPEKGKKPKGGGRKGPQTSNLGVEQPENQGVKTTETEGGQQGGDQNKDRKFDLNDLPPYLLAIASAIRRRFTGNLGPLPTYIPSFSFRYPDVYRPPITETPPPPTDDSDFSHYLKLARTYGSQHIPYGRPFYISPIIEAMQEGQVRRTAMNREAALRYQELAQRYRSDREGLIARQHMDVQGMIPPLQSYEGTARYDTIGRMYKYLAEMLQAQRTWEAYASLAPNVQLPGFTMPLNLPQFNLHQFDTRDKKTA